MYSSLDILYLSLAVGFLIFISVLSYAIYQLAQTLKSIKGVAEDVEDISGDVKSVKDGVKTGLASLIGNYLKKRG